MCCLKGGARAMIGVAWGSWCRYWGWTFGGFGRSVAQGPESLAFPTVTVGICTLRPRVSGKGLVLVDVGAENVREVTLLWVHHFGFPPVAVQLGRAGECRRDCVGVIVGRGIASG